MPQNFRKKLYPGYKKRKKRIHPDDKPPEERYKNIRDAEQAVQDADMEEGNYLQDPENNTLAITAKDIEELTVKQKQQQDARENKEFDDAVADGTLEGLRKGVDIRKKERQNLMESIVNNIHKVKDFAVDSIEDAKEFEDMRNPLNWGSNIGALGIRAIDTNIPRTPKELMMETAQLITSGPTGYSATKLAKEIPMVASGIDKLDKATTAFRTNLYNKIHASIFNPDGTIGKKGIQPLMSKGDGYSYRKGRPLKNPIWDNLTPTVQKQFTDAGIDSDKAKFFIETWTREVGATVEGLPFTNRTFEFMQGKLLPEILEDLKGVNLSDGLQLDHIAQLRAMTPFYKGRNLTQAQKIRRILIREGIFGGHNPKNLKYLPTDVHTVKTNFWKQNVGDAGEKFFEGRPMKTYADVERAAKEMKVFIDRSNKVVENLSVQYKLMRDENISNDKLWKLLQKVDLNEGRYNLKDVRKLIDEIDADITAGNVPTLSKEEFTSTMQKMKRSVDWDELGLADKMRYMEEQTGMKYDQIDEFIKSGLIDPKDL